MGIVQVVIMECPGRELILAHADPILKTLVGGSDHVTRFGLYHVASGELAWIAGLDIGLIIVRAGSAQRERSPVTSANLSLFKLDRVSEVPVGSVVHSNLHHPAPPIYRDN